MNILITGGAGYIGAVLVPLLLRSGHHVTVLDNFRHDLVSLASSCSDPAFSVVRGDCRDPQILKPLMATHDVLIPLAAIVGAPACDRDQSAATGTNLDAIRLLLDLGSRQQRVIYPNTNSGYGVGDSDAPCTEESPLHPISLYARTKAEAEDAVIVYMQYTHN